MKKLLLLLPFLLLSCQNTTTPSNSPPSQINAVDATKTGVLNIIVKDGLTQQVIGGASVTVIIDGEAITKTTDNTGKVFFDKLTPENNYNVEVKSANYISNSVSTASSNLVVTAGATVDLEVKMYKVLGTLSGKVVSDNDQPLEGSVITVGNDTALSDNQGNFRVNISNLSAQSVSISKTGYQTLEYGSIGFLPTEKDKTTGTVKLKKIERPISVLFDTSHKPFGNDGITNFNNLSSALQSSGYQVSFENFFNKPADTIDILVISSPSVEYNEDDLSNLEKFVRSGKKIVVLGEWGGFGNFSSQSINKLLEQANLKINTDVVKENDKNNFILNNEQIISSTIIPHFITNNVKKLSFYSSASVELINAGARSLDQNITKLLAYNSVSGFKIQIYNQGQFGLIGVSTIGVGKVVVIGDTSIFSNNDNDKNGKANIDEFDNKRLMTNIFSW